MSQNLNGLETHLSLTICEPQELLDTSCDWYFKDVFDADKLPQFWVFVKTE